MILIISNEDDFTTNEVIKWLIALKKQFIRVSEKDIFSIKTENKKIYLQSKNKKFYLDEISSLWYRRGELKFKRVKYGQPSINFHMDKIQKLLEDYVIKTLQSKKHINKQTNK